MGISTISMAIFNSYVKLPEGISFDGYVSLVRANGLVVSNQPYFLVIHLILTMA
jgi:hypothetical protein